ncbi:MAG: hypothetical protein ACRD16_16125 [Thermoanaerobaculia bacterium]
MEQTLNHSFFHAEERDSSGKKRAKIFLAVLLVFAGLVALAVVTQRSQPQVSRVTTETSTAAQSAPPPVDVPMNPEAPAVPQLVPSAPEPAPSTSAKSEVAPAPPAPAHHVITKKAPARGRTIVTETPVPKTPAPSIAPPQLAPVPIEAPAAPSPIPTTIPTTTPATSATTTSSAAPSTDEPPPPPPA